MIINWHNLFYLVSIFALRAVKSQDDNNETQIQYLEAEKNKLYKEMEAAIDDGLRALQRANDTEAGSGAGEGMQYLRALKLQLQEARSEESSNDTVDELNPADDGVVLSASPVSNDTNSTNLRRFVYKKKKKRGPDELNEIFVYKDVYEKKNIEPEKSKLMLANQKALEKKLFDWMVKRQQEKQRLKQYLEKKRAHLLEVVTEKCPRFGFGKKMKKKKKTRRNNEGDIINRRMDAVDAHRKAIKHRPKYPCCRKCCKKSYLGCL